MFGTWFSSPSAPTPSNEALPVLPTGCVAVLYATREGHTAKVASRIASVLSDVLPNRSISVHDVRSFTPKLTGVCGVVLAASVHVGEHESEMVNYVRTHAEDLRHLPTLFISVSLSEIASEEKDRTPEQRAKAAAAVKDVAEKFFTQTGFRPTLFLPVAGCLAFTKYNWVKKCVLYAISRGNGWPGGEMNHDYEFTNWRAVEDITKRFAKDLQTQDENHGQQEKILKSVEPISDSAASAAGVATSAAVMANSSADKLPVQAPASIQAKEQLIQPHEQLQQNTNSVQSSTTPACIL